MTDDNVFVQTVLRHKVRLPASALTKQWKSHVLQALRTQFCGTCSRFGFVDESGLSIVSVDDPVMQLANLNGDACCNVVFKAMVCNPTVGAVMRGTVAAANKFGVLVKCGPVDCVVTKAPVAQQLKSDVDVESVNIGDILHVRILGKLFNIGDLVISAVGRIISEEEARDWKAIETTEKGAASRAKAKAKKQAETRVVHLRATGAEQDGEDNDDDDNSVVVAEDEEGDLVDDVNQRNGDEDEDKEDADADGDGDGEGDADGDVEGDGDGDADATDDIDAGAAEDADADADADGDLEVEDEDEEDDGNGDEEDDEVDSISYDLE